MQTISSFGPDFPFAFDNWLAHEDGLGAVPVEAHGESVAVIGAGAAGIVAAYELMKLGLRPIVFEAGRLGGRLRSERFAGAPPEVVAELGGMRFPDSSTCFWHYARMLGLESRPFPNPLTEAAGSTVVDLEGQPHYARTVADLPPIFQEVSAAWDAALKESVPFDALQDAIRRKDADAVKAIWDPLLEQWDERTFYDFVTSSRSFSELSFRHREIFGQVGFGTGGWDSDFPNSMLEILRVNATECDDNQHFIVGGAEQLPRRLWEHAPETIVHWPHGTTLQDLNDGAPRTAVRHIERDLNGDLEITDRWGHVESFKTVIATCQSWLLTTSIDVSEELFSNKNWMALDRTRYMQSSKTFVMVKRPFWKDRDPKTGQHVMSMTLTDRLTRGTYLFDLGDDKPGVICLTYSWMSDALKMLPLDVEKRVELALGALHKIYPKVDLEAEIIGDPITVSWESDPNFLGAFKGALPGHYRYNQRMYSHFMQQDMPDAERGIFLAGDDISFTPGWVEGAIQTALNAVWGVVNHYGGATSSTNPGPGDVFIHYGPTALAD